MDFPEYEAARLFTIEKRSIDDECDFPSPGTRIEVGLISVDGRETFVLDASRGAIGFHGKLQNRTRSTVILARLDYSGSPHTNPDSDITMPCPHLHVYRHGYAEKFAYPVSVLHDKPLNVVTIGVDIVHLNVTFEREIPVNGPNVTYVHFTEFFGHVCNITKMPIFRWPVL